ncbi:MAG: DMT family transporter [Rhodobacter sp.]|jgi:drug/metabolite transporter (DMT)-like permease|nr:DMT family transporter [Rhodobacter sp.]
MLLTVFLFTVMDAIAKGLAARYDTFQVVWARYTSQTLVAVIILLPRLKSVAKTRYLGLQLIRSAFLFCATISFFFGIVWVGLAQSSAIMSVNPMLISIGAFLILGEQFGIRRAIGVGLGLLGALIIIRPGAEVFSPLALLPLVAAVCYAGYSLSTRFLGREESVWTSFLYTAAFGTVVATLIVPWFWTTPTLMDAGVMILLGVIGGAGQLCLIKALSVAEAGAIAPFAYIGPVLAATWGMLFFDETPDLWTWVGVVVIIGAGIYVWQREYRVAKSGR